ncbi:MAG: hypothetical protein KAI95_12325, partial [Bacteroidales bacterium]|nr:hypothetical protein [Bacteroidales bacterium]
IVARQEITQAEVLFQSIDRYERVQLKPIGEDMFEASVPVPEGAVSLSYVIEVKDIEGNRAQFPETGKKNPIQVILGTDEHAPEVRLERVTKAKPGKNLSVHALVSDPAGIEWVRLRYRHLTQFADYQTVDMEIDPATGLYQAIIPGDFIVPEWNLIYFVEAVDSLGNGCMIPDLDQEMPYVIVKIEQ